MHLMSFVLQKLGYLTSYNYDKKVLPNKFTLYRKCRESHGGGVLIAVNNLRPNFLIPSPPKLEVVAINLSFAAICTVYIPPNPNIALFNLLVDFLNSFSQSEELLILLLSVTSICLTFVGPLSLLTSFVTLCLILTYLSS